ncbi:uncharacterized protein METZ01_LOCUS346717, partial [marine metagenome]
MMIYTPSILISADLFTIDLDFLKI